MANVGDTVLALILGEETEVILTKVDDADGCETGEMFQDAQCEIDGELVYLGRRAANWRNPEWEQWATC